jgi:hypothetical protein
MNKNKICFIIAHKYFRGYESYLSYYVDNIQKMYPEALTIVVDNNSQFKGDVFDPLKDYDNIVLLDNDIKCKFELGAYQVGMGYLIDNDLLGDFSHCVCTQDNFVLKNYYDFDQSMAAQHSYARPINSMYADGARQDICDHVLNTLDMNDNWDKVNFCWCSSFVVATHKVKQLYGWLQKIVQTTRTDSEGAERYLARLLWELNERRDCGDIDGTAADLHIRHYDTWQVNIHDDATSFFVKKVQQKNEHTVDTDTPQVVVPPRVMIRTPPIIKRNDQEK